MAVSERDLHPGGLYRLVDHPDARVPWFEVSDLDRSTDRPLLGDALLYLGRTNTFLGDEYPIYGWQFLHRGRYVVAFNSNFAKGLSQLEGEE